MIIPQLIFNGMIAGSIYALVASGFALIYSTNRFIHFAHGATVALGAYTLFVLFVGQGLNFYVAAGLTVILTGIFGVLMYRLLYQPLKKRGSSNAVLLIASLALLIALENLLLLFFGAQVRTYGVIKVQKGLELLGATVTPLQLIIIGLALLLLVLTWLFVRFTRLGQTVRAVADNKELAEISGINTEKIYQQTFFMGSALAGVAGLLVGLEQSLDPLMGSPLIVKGFTGAVIGGLTSLPGSVLGSYLLGLVENLGIGFVPSGWKDAIAFGLLFVFLLFRPSGILGISKGIRE